MAGSERNMQDLLAGLRASSSRTTPPPPQRSPPVASQQQQTSDPTRATAGTNSAWSTVQPRSSSQYHTYSNALPQGGQQGESASDRTTNLLNLLRFNQDGQQPQTPLTGSQNPPSTILTPSSGHTSLNVSMVSGSAGAAARNVHGRGVSASDLVASFMGKPNPASTATHETASPAAAASPAPSANPQDYLLQLLNRSQMGHSPSSPAGPLGPVRKLSGNQNQGASKKDELPASPPVIQLQNDKEKDKKINSGSSSEGQNTNTEAKHEARSKNDSIAAGTASAVEASKGSIFTYVNPFDQLAASSPRNRSGASTPRKEPPSMLKAGHDAAKGEESRDENSARFEAVQPSVRKEKSTIQHQAIKTSAADKILPESIGAPTTNSATVAQALSDVSQKVSRQADFALARAEEEKQLPQSNGNMSTTKERSPRKKEATVTSKTTQKTRSNLEKQDSSTGKHGEADLPMKSHATATAPQAEGHASADDEQSSANGSTEHSIPVHNFLLKPFVSIEVMPSIPPTTRFREDTITEIARLKKDFDQIDRTLTTASADYIIYSLPKVGGIRVIRQEDGHDRQLFKENKDYVFNVSISTPARGKTTDDLQTSIVTASSGTVYWTALRQNGDNLDAENLLEHSLIFPPVWPNEDHSSGTQLKTRAKRSSRHPEFFAIGRGRLIQVIFPLHAAGSRFVDKHRTVDTSAYFKDRSLKINTGKAGKDFTFSEDDTVVATLDKAGRLRFWDVRELTHESNSGSAVLSPIEIRTPILTLSTAMPSEKSWPTSVLFVDKMRPYTKGAALRYVVVGMKQNHTLQLWDLGMGKAIQEVHFPHSNESDAICSLCYHPPSGIIVVGHPTRNSIYFIHLSAPKYNLPGMNQARYLTRIADKDTALPKLESTAVMSGMREYSFASKGQLRSLDLLPMTPEISELKEEPGLFELYVMHSRGVTMLSVHREDLGWSEDMKVVNPLDAEAEGVIRIKELLQPPAVITSENSSVNGDVAPPTIGSKKGANTQGKHVDNRGNDDQDINDNKERSQPTAASGDKAEKRKKKKAPQKEDDPTNDPTPAPVAPAILVNSGSKGAQQNQNITHTKESSHLAPKEHMADLSNNHGHHGPHNTEISATFIEQELRRIEAGVSEEFKKALDRELGQLYKRISDDKQIRDAQYGADREALLRLISKHLGQNLEAALGKIITDSMEQKVVPSFKEIIAKTLQQEMNNNLSKSLSKSVSQELVQQVRKSLQQPDLLSSIAAGIATSSGQSNQKTTEALQQQNLRLGEKVNELQAQISDNNSKIDQLSKAVDALHETLRAVTITNVQPQPTTPQTVYDQNSVQNSHLGGSSSQVEVSVLDNELREIAHLMESGEVESATIKWLQTKQQADIFDQYFVNLDPIYTLQCSSLVNLSVAAAVTSSLSNHLSQKLNWLDTILSSIDYTDTDILEVAPKIMDVIHQRLEDRRLQLARAEPSSPFLHRLTIIMQQADRLALSIGRG